MAELYFKENEQYHIIHFYDEYTFSYGRNEGNYFLATINSHGFVKVDLFLLEELDSLEILKHLKNVKYYAINFSKPSETIINDKMKISVEEDGRHTNIIFEAEEQKWYVGIGDGERRNSYYSGKLLLLLFSVYKTPSDFSNLSPIDRIYPSFYKATLEFKKSRQRQDFDSPLYKEASNIYFHLLHYSHPKPFDGPSDKFEEWIEKEEAFYCKHLKRRNTQK
ncbi:hypothetical protein [Bacillus mycoides]|uniref:hypothetical protein n=1 Tax=Bacillus mycoides TaxID=1405 RepID=UPI001C028E1E|nr:hypothetical protein [Bacillus mycoides]MCQ6532280.1 hypothetical protein [Bacillus mycoides]QWI54492.1 hypothetical protein EXW42_10135 [Bacillus mycoides]QWI91109.1 hypothetical protein J5W00_06365 [Bacillus mycoides]